MNPVRLLMRFLAARGVATDELLVAHGITSPILEDIEGRISFEAARRLWEDAGRILDDPDVGLAAGQEGPLGVGVIAYVVQASATVGDAYRMVSRFHRLVTDVGCVELEEGRQRARMIIRTPGPEGGLSRHIAEMYLSLWLRGGRELTGVSWSPIAVRFRHAQPASVENHRRFFRAPLTFDHPTDELEFDRSLLDLPLKTADPTLARMLDRYCEEILARLPLTDDFTTVVRQIVATSLGNEGSTLERLATHFHTTPRTLQRRLSSEGLSLRVLIDETRHELALRHVARCELTIAEIAFLLGFDAVTSFHRAFRRWTGVTPAQYRQRPAESV